MLLADIEAPRRYNRKDPMTPQEKAVHAETQTQLAAEARRQLLEKFAASGEPIVQFFAFSHLPEQLQAVSEPFAQLAGVILELPRNAERTIALRKLLESKDAAVRTKLFKEPTRT